MGTRVPHVTGETPPVATPPLRRAYVLVRTAAQSPCRALWAAAATTRSAKRQPLRAATPFGLKNKADGSSTANTDVSKQGRRQQYSQHRRLADSSPTSLGARPSADRVLDEVPHSSREPPLWRRSRQRRHGHAALHDLDAAALEVAPHDQLGPVVAVVEVDMVWSAADERETCGSPCSAS